MVVIMMSLLAIVVAVMIVRRPLGSGASLGFYPSSYVTAPTGRGILP